MRHITSSFLLALSVISLVFLGERPVIALPPTETLVKGPLTKENLEKHTNTKSSSSVSDSARVLAWAEKVERIDDPHHLPSSPKRSDAPLASHSSSVSSFYDRRSEHSIFLPEDPSTYQNFISEHLPLIHTALNRIHRTSRSSPAEISPENRKILSEWLEISGEIDIKFSRIRGFFQNGVQRLKELRLITPKMLRYVGGDDNDISTVQSLLKPLKNDYLPFLSAFAIGHYKLSSISRPSNLPGKHPSNNLQTLDFIHEIKKNPNVKINAKLLSWSTLKGLDRAYNLVLEVHWMMNILKVIPVYSMQGIKEMMKDNRMSGINLKELSNRKSEIVAMVRKSIEDNQGHIGSKPDCDLAALNRLCMDADNLRTMIHKSVEQILSMIDDLKDDLMKKNRQVHTYLVSVMDNQFLANTLPFLSLYFISPLRLWWENGMAF
ncbi:hypothetical protein BJ684DRAFT_15683 [Piptocephalis cylindrospora]|uniref:Uncharacterized protein n=1 Tax=Piptocephalis cylindrospora TaxID=1907219 RepID=A0A4P9Y4X3_9FUNG|nr:hypothetical protein BJ684DRAFT_15683 [Piptocephalis cylindrospora]|eukprot:RKP13965.1 hypothetical protein BJ684DRAFT_15683 [Piptocephalis cylindrospora]